MEVVKPLNEQLENGIKLDIVNSDNDLIKHFNVISIESKEGLITAENLSLSYHMNFPLFPKQLKLMEVSTDAPEQNVKFINCHFQKDIKFNDYEGLLFFEDCIFFSEIDFSDSVFSQKVRFRNCEFKEKVIFDNTSFVELADFWKSCFRRPTIFYKVDFFNTVVFSKTTFMNNVLFTFTLFEKIAIFRQAQFMKGLDLSLANIPGNLSLFDLQLNDFYVPLKEVSDEEFDEDVTTRGIIHSKNKRETFRIIKHHYLINNDSVSAQKFSLLESSTHLKEVSRHSWSFNRTTWDYFLLSANWVSNNHRMSYERGILFTLGFSLLLSYFSAIATKEYYFSFYFENISLGEIFKNFFTFLTPTHDSDYIEKNSTAGFYLLDFVGRIIVAFGIYQTIQAFRKFK